MGKMFALHRPTPPGPVPVRRETLLKAALSSGLCGDRMIEQLIDQVEGERS